VVDARSLRVAACRDFAPAGDLLFFACPKKRRQKKGHPVRSVRLGRTALRCSVFVGRAELTARASLATFRQLPEVSSRSALSRAPQSPALLDGSQGPRDTLASFAGLVLSTRFASCLSEGEAMRSEPCRAASRGWRRGAQGLRGARASALRELTSRRMSERSGQRPRSEFGAAPQDRAPQSSPAAGRAATVGSPFFGYFLWRSKESNSAAGPRPGMRPTQ
jgi:hypothetical protein